MPGIPGIIDADTHVFEPPEMWERLDPDMYQRRAHHSGRAGDTVYRRSNFWIIDGNIFPKPAGKGGFLLGTPTQPQPDRKMPDVRARELLDIPAGWRRWTKWVRRPGYLSNPLSRLRHDDVEAGSGSLAGRTTGLWPKPIDRVRTG